MFALGWIAMAAALGGAGYALLSLRALARFARTHLPAPAHCPAVTLLKPLHGAEPDLRDNLETFCTRDYPGAVQIVFGVQDARDAAIAVVETLKAAHPEIDILLSIGARDTARNPKIANLTAMLPHAKHDLIVLSDSDMRVPPDYLRNVVAALDAPGVGAVTCYYRGLARGNVWSRLAAMGTDYQFLPSTVFAASSGVDAPCFGSTIALTRAVLAGIGGFENFGDYLADDYEIGRAVRARGLALAYPRMVLDHSSTEGSLGEVFRHELRWARTIRTINPAGHAGSVVTHSVALGLLAAAVLGFTPAALLAFGIIVAVRTYQKLRIDRLLGRPGPSIFLLPLRDMLSFAVFLSSFFVKQVDWRGARYQVKPSGELA